MRSKHSTEKLLNRVNQSPHVWENVNFWSVTNKYEHVFGIEDPLDLCKITQLCNVSFKVKPAE